MDSRKSTCNFQDSDPKKWPNTCTMPIKKHGLCTTHLDVEKKRLASKIIDLNKNLYLVRARLDKLSE